LLYLPSVLVNNWQGWERWIAIFMLWFALVGTLSGWAYDIEGVKRFLTTLGSLAWLVILVLGGYAVIFPGRAMLSGRLVSFLYRPNALAINLFLCIIAVGYRALYMKPNRFKTIDLIVLGVALVMLIMTGTRAAGFAIVPVLIVLVRGRTKGYMVIGAFSILLIFGIAWSIPSINAIILERFLGVTAEMTTAGRFERWAAQWPLVFERPLFGHGIEYVDAIVGVNPHNSFLVIAIEGGFINVIVFIFVFVVGIGGALFRSFGFSSKADRKIAHLILAAATGVAFICVFESIATGIGGIGITVTWMLLQLTEGVRPVRSDEMSYYEQDKLMAEYDYSDECFDLEVHSF
jgi:O-antigen ligase